ncbi:uncharacterized protein [Miscanthus floridulus]|uniref:uncharacterized protein n=1 Tax=Miscanthus floridulus TaxID=154761 RepID=UPI0034591BF6
MPTFLWWSEATITFDQIDHPKSIPHPGRCPLVVDRIIDPKRLTKVLMDGGSGLNIIYAKTLDEIGIDQTCLRPTRAPFHSIMLETQAMPLGQIDLPITFRDQFNYRMETLTFEVVGFPRTFHAILGRPCYVKFMAIPNYTYLELTISGLDGVITVDTSFQCAYECEVECCGHAAAIIASGEHATIKREVTKEAPDTKKSTGTFKEVLIDPNNIEGKTVCVGTTLFSK